LLEREQLTRSRARALGKDYDRAVIRADEAPGRVEGCDRCCAVLPVDRDVTCCLPRLAENRDQPQLGLCDEPEALGECRGDCEDVVPRYVIAREDLRLVQLDRLEALRANAHTARPEDPARPGARDPIEELRRCAKQCT